MFTETMVGVQSKQEEEENTTKFKRKHQDWEEMSLLPKMALRCYLLSKLSMEPTAKDKYLNI